MGKTSIELAREAVMDRIRAHLKQPGVTKKALAARAILHQNTLQGIEGPDWKPSDDTLIALERQLPAAEQAAA